MNNNFFEITSALSSWAHGVRSKASSCAENLDRAGLESCIEEIKSVSTEIGIDDYQYTDLQVEILRAIGVFDVFHFLCEYVCQDEYYKAFLVMTEQTEDKISRHTFHQKLLNEPEYFGFDSYDDQIAAETSKENKD